MVVALGLVPLLLWSSALSAGPPSALTVRFFDVGQGDAALLTSPGGVAILVDGGPEPDRVASELVALGVKRLDLIYQRAEKATKQFSLVDFKVKTRDLHDTLSVRGGALFNMIDNGKFNARDLPSNGPANSAQANCISGSSTSPTSTSLTESMAPTKYE